MKIGIISDIHSNLEAFESVIAFFEKNKIDKLVICGDVIGYGPDPKKCVDMANEHSDIILKGNHEEGIIKNDFSRFKQYAQITLLWTVKEIGEMVEEIKIWGERKQIENLLFVHASITDPFYRYILKFKDAEEEFEKFKNEICFIGHTHIPGGFKKNVENGKIEKIFPDFNGKIYFRIEEGFKYIINVGSVGFPRDGFPFACVGIYDTSEKYFKLDRIQYNIEKTFKKIIDKGLPSKIGNLLKGF